MEEALAEARKLCGGEVKVVSRERVRGRNLSCVSPGESSPVCLGDDRMHVAIVCVDDDKKPTSG